MNMNKNTVNIKVLSAFVAISLTLTANILKVYAETPEIAETSVSAETEIAETIWDENDTSEEVFFVQVGEESGFFPLSQLMRLDVEKAILTNASGEKFLYHDGQVEVVTNSDDDEAVAISIAKNTDAPKIPLTFINISDANVEFPSISQALTSLRNGGLSAEEFVKLFK